jgi:RNA polymerase sigma-70 factor, ECF subfamily
MLQVEFERDLAGPSSIAGAAHGKNRLEDPALPSDEIALLLERVTRGDSDAVSALLEHLYGELHRLAAREMRKERAEHTLQPTALLHEAYLKLIGTRENVHFENRAHFMALAARAMRSILVDHARRKKAVRRTAPGERVSEEGLVAEFEERAIDLLALDAALEKLQANDPRMVRIVELRFFGGLSIEETAQAVGTSTRTVERELMTARAWLRKEIG